MYSGDVDGLDAGFAAVFSGEKIPGDPTADISNPNESILTCRGERPLEHSLHPAELFREALDFDLIEDGKFPVLERVADRKHGLLHEDRCAHCLRHFLTRDHEESLLRTLE